MRHTMIAIGRWIRTHAGLAWVLFATATVITTSVADVLPSIRLVFVLTFVLTVPGFLVLDLRSPTDPSAKIAMAIASSVSFYILLVSIALLGDPSWLAPVGAVFAAGAAMASFHRWRTRRMNGPQISDARDGGEATADEVVGPAPAGEDGS